MVLIRFKMLALTHTLSHRSQIRIVQTCPDIGKMYKIYPNLLVHKSVHTSVNCANREDKSTAKIPYLSVQDAINLDLSNNEKVQISGWVKSIRKMGKKTTFIDLIDGLSSHRMQIVADSKFVSDNISYHSAVTVLGTVVKSKYKGQEVELHASDVILVNATQLEYSTDLQSIEKHNEDDENTDESDMYNVAYPFHPRKRYPDNFCRMYPEFRSKLADFGSVLRIRSAATHAINDFFHKRNFIQIHTPILTGNDCEGAGEVFTVQPASNSSLATEQKDDPRLDGTYFGKDVYLTVSGQLHLEAICNGITRVYNFSPVFRAEHGQTRKHLSEFWMVEAEVGFAYDTKNDVALLIESLVKHVICTILENNYHEIELFAKLCQENNLSKNTTNIKLLESIANINKPFIVMTYDEALDILMKNSDKFQSKPEYGEGLGNEHELYLVEKHCNNTPVHIIEWPKSTKPFYTRIEETSTGVTSNNCYAAAVDTLFPKIGELCGGALREYRTDILLERMKECGLYNDKNVNAMKWYLNLRQIGGAAPTGGFGLGFDRLIQFILGINNIRDTMPFPRTPHKCRL